MYKKGKKLSTTIYRKQADIILKMNNRLFNLKDRLKTAKIDSTFITSPYNISYLTNLFPSTIEEREFYLLITKGKNYLLAPKMFMMAVKNRTSDFAYIEITGKKGLFESVQEIIKKEDLKTLGFEEESLLYKEFDHLKKLKDIELIALEDFVEDLRKIKTKSEIEKIKSACEITDECFKDIIKKIKLGITELELKSEIEFYLNRYGGNAFSPIVAFGKNAAVPHHISTNSQLKTNSFVLLDFGAKFEGYCSDMSRTVFFGEPTDIHIKLYNTVLEAQETALEKLKEWNNKNFQVSSLQEISESHISKMGFEPFPHSLGHGVGLQVHELPSVSKYSEGNELENGMIITIEPGIYDKKIGGVRIEDMVLVNKGSFEVLTTSPRELTIIH